jgi:hypothetical protein
LSGNNFLLGSSWQAQAVEHTEAPVSGAFLLSSVAGAGNDTHAKARQFDGIDIGIAPKPYH